MGECFFRSSNTCIYKPADTDSTDIHNHAVKWWVQFHCVRVYMCVCMSVYVCICLLVYVYLYMFEVQRTRKCKTTRSPFLLLSLTYMPFILLSTHIYVYIHVSLFWGQFKCCLYSTNISGIISDKCLMIGKKIQPFLHATMCCVYDAVYVCGSICVHI